MEQSQLTAWKATANHIIKHLARRNMTGHFCETAADAVRVAQDLIEPGASVTWGGSVTLEQTGIKDMLRAGDYHLVDRSSARTDDQRRTLWEASATADWHLMGTNAITLDGQLVNIDGRGDRLSLLIHGPQHVLVVAGMNKVVHDIDAALKRIRIDACPPNATRLHTNTPCELTGTCAECHSERCMCCQTVITRHSRPEGRIHVILVGESLGY